MQVFEHETFEQDSFELDKNPKYPNTFEVLKNGGILSQIIPTYKQRDEQIKLAVAIEESINAGEDLISSAPTGTGKSIAYLVPAILAHTYDKKSGKTSRWKFVVSTATKALQEQLYAKDIPLMKEAFSKIGINVKATIMKGRGNYISLRRFNEYTAKLEPIHIGVHNKVMDWVGGSNFTGDFDELPFVLEGKYKSLINSTTDDCQGKECPMYNKCKFYEAKKKTYDADVIVVNHDLLSTDLMLKNEIGFGTLPDYDGIIIDEAHAFEDTVGKYLGWRLSKHSISNMKGVIGNLLKEEKHVVDENPALKETLEETINNLIKMADSFFFNFVPEDDGESMRLKPRHITSSVTLSYKRLVSKIKSLDKIINMIPISSERSEELHASIDKRIEDILDRLDKLYNIDEYYYDMVYWSSLGKRNNVSIECVPIEVNEYLNDWLFSRGDLEDVLAGEKASDKKMLKTVIMTSATITIGESFEFAKERLGVDDCNEIIVDSPFNYRRQAVTYIPKNIVEPTPRDGAVFTRLMSQNIVELIKLTKGRAFLLFTSYSEMDKVYNEIADKIPYTVLKQGDLPKHLIIKKFKEDINSVLFATQSYWEGISVEGEALSLVCIDKLPFPLPSEPVIEARIEKIKRDGGNWFDHYYLPLAVIKLQQGFGRLIRTVDDIGIFCLFDKRVITKRYGEKVLRSLPDTLQTRSLEKIAVFTDYMDKKLEARKQRLMNKS